MGRKQFRQDLEATVSNSPSHIEDVRSSEDSEISFDYTYHLYGSRQKASLRLLATNVDGYPHDNDYMIFANDDEVPTTITSALDVIGTVIRNHSVYDALAEISNCLHATVTSGHSTNPIVLNSASEDESSINIPVRGRMQQSQADYDDDDDMNDSEFGMVSDDDETYFNDASKNSIPTLGNDPRRNLPVGGIRKIKEDLREAKQAGFKIGIIGDLKTSGIVCVSLRVSKLGISDEVMKAWGLKPQQYFVVLIRFLRGYATLENMMGTNKMNEHNHFRLGLCSSYKPNPTSAFDAFSEATSDTQKSSQVVETTSDDFVPMFISHSLNQLFEDRFGPVTRYRDAYMLGWAGAEQLAFDTQGSVPDSDRMVEYVTMTDSNEGRALPPIVMADTMAGRRADQCSMPLVAMQFALRHFVRCTDFCLVCHCSSGSTFEALKPYVCSKDICLYQYLFLGFGPSIEWEILSQPYVVDLLISFCWTQARAGKLKDFPTGISLAVPILPQYSLPDPYNHPHQYIHPSNKPPKLDKGGSPASNPAFTVPYNCARRELLFDSEKAADGNKLKKGEFLAITSPKSIEVVYHCVEEILLPTVKLGPPIHTVSDDHKKTITDTYVESECYLFDFSFDDLSSNYKSKAIIAMLDTLPSVMDMVQYLQSHNFAQEVNLRHWRERISVSALNVLRWIIASNRSCIMQVDTVIDSAQQSNETLPLEDRVTGMDAYMQFRFASGAPDKEQKFVDCVNTHAVGKQNSTIFAWHGSPLHNWHSIIREGLRFDDIAHGRAYGNGVYMSLHAGTSMGYMGMGPHYGSGKSGWINSALNITGAMSLNEVVNKPESFVSRSPHYVVANIEWIQTRYLFIQTSTPHSKKNRPDVEYVLQDPTHTPSGTHGGAIGVPITAIAKSRRSQKQSKPETKKRKSIGSGRIEDPFTLDDDTESIATINEDREFLLDDESHTGLTPVPLDSDTDMADDSDDAFGFTAIPSKKVRHEEPKSRCENIGGCLLDMDSTDFYPGATDLSSIKMLPPPEDSSKAANTALLRAFRTLVTTQRDTPAHQLGWYINPEGGENLYQWIIELHSFDKDIPLATDMKNAKVSSVVLEMRFTNQFPYAPPFVRVVKPRFLPFNQGGGGHVTEGGAICMELLTNNGWTAASTIESVLLQIRLAMSEQERPGRLLHDRSGGRYGGNSDSYGVAEAITAYERACRTHGWTIPPSFKSLQRADGSNSRM